MKYPKLRELREAFRSLFGKPVTSRFPRERHTPFTGFRGKPVPDDKECVGCGACANVCPARAIEVKEDLGANPPVREVIWHYDQCIYCGQCERYCSTEKGVSLSREFDLSVYDRSALTMGLSKELARCEGCGEIIAPRAQLLWLIRRLGPLASGNFTLLYTAQKELRITDTPPGEQSIVSRAGLYRVLCPKCRHTVLVFNQTGKQT